MYTEVSEKDAIEFQTTNFYFQKLSVELNEKEKKVEVLTNQLKSVQDEVTLLKKENQQLRNIMSHLKSDSNSQRKKCNIL
jgi:chromosome segregation ATPase